MFLSPARQAYFFLQAKSGSLEAAVVDLTALLALDPTNASAKKDLLALKKRLVDHAAATKKR
jgi:hypothetical protein